MRKTRVLLFLFVLLGAGLFAQSGNKTTTPVGNNDALQQIVSLKDQAAKVNAAYSQLLIAATGSRTVYAAAVTTLNEACNVYLAELKKEEASQANAAIRSSISNEQALVKKIQSDYCSTGN
jgi:hypothetical protein